MGEHGQRPKDATAFLIAEAFYPGLLALVGETERALGLVRNYHTIWRRYGGLPEFYNIQTHKVHNDRAQYPIRPE